MSTLLYNRRDLATVSTTQAGTTLSIANFTAGEKRTFGLRFVRPSPVGNLLEEDPDLRSLTVSVGLVDERPKSGTIRYQLGAGPSNSNNTTAALAYNHNAAALAEAINALPMIGEPVTVEEVPGGWTIYGLPGATQITPRENKLWPLSQLRTFVHFISGEPVHEVRLLQAQLETVNQWVRVLPPAPSITTVRDGGVDSTGTVPYSEIQRIDFPPEFRGTYQLRRPDTMARTEILSLADGPERVQAAVQTIFPEGTVRVFNPDDNYGLIEWTGDLLGVDMPELEVVVGTAPVGDPTFTLDFDRPAVYAALRGQAEVRVFFEARGYFVGPDDDPEGPGRPQVLFREQVTLRRDQNYDGAEAARDPLWNRPPNPVDYVPATEDQVGVGQGYWAGVIGEDGQTTIVVDHDMATEAISSIVVRENISGGRVLIEGVDYTWTLPSANSIELVFAEETEDDQYYLVLTAAIPVTAWLPHTHTKEQIVGLVDDLEDLFGRVNNLEDLILPGVAAARPADGTGLITVIPEIAEVIGYRGDGEPWTEEGLNVRALPARPPLMLPAVHDSTPTDPLPTPLPAAAAGSVWIADGRTLIPGGGGIRSSYADNDQPVASDGRLLYPARRSGTTNSYYPAGMERTLFAMGINDQMLAVNRSLEINFGVQAQLVAATCKAQWVLVVELGTFSAETEPATLGLNLEAVNWQAPVFSQVIVLSRLAQSHFFGVRIQRKATEFLLDQSRYGVWSPNNAAAPASANFAIRARLERFDTENRSDPRGWVGWRLIGSLETDSEGKQVTKPARAIIS